MQRSKQQALWFLLGAVLVGGVLGFSADRVMAAKKGPRPMERRTSFYNEFGITPDQRNKMDSIFDENICKTEELMGSVKPALDSLKKQSRTDWLAVMTAEQRVAFDAREARMKARRDSIEKVRAAERSSKDKDRGPSDRFRRCGGGPRPIGPGPGPGPDHRGPGGPYFR